MADLSVAVYGRSGRAQIQPPPSVLTQSLTETLHVSDPTVTVDGGADPVTATRLVYGGSWEDYVGVEGGIPSGSWTKHADVTLGANATTNLNNINNAIAAAAGSSQYILLPSGTYDVAGSVTLDESGVEIRGATDANGVPTTILNFTAGQERILIQNTGWDISGSSQFTRRNVSSGVSRGSTQFTLASAPTGLVVDQIMWITNPSPVGDGGAFDFYGTDSYGQCARVTNIAGSVVDFYPPLHADYLSGTTQVGWRTQGSSTTRSGIRNLSLTGSGNHYIRFSGTDECWAVNIKTYDVPSNTYHCYLYCNNRTEIRHCDFAHMSNLTNSTYCVYVQYGTGLLIEDNYFHDAPNIMPYTGMVASAFAYNYITDLPYSPTSFLSQIVFHHGVHNAYNLFEGNWLATGYHDNGGAATCQTWFRNRMRGYDATGPKTTNTKCLTIEHGGNLTGYTYAGNVLGENGYHTVVADTFTGTSGNFNGDTIYMLHTDCVDFERIGNYNTVNDAVAAAEALSAGEALVTSYLHSSKPSWFSSLPWPWVSPADYAQSNDPENFPAGYRAANGVDP